MLLGHAVANPVFFSAKSDTSRGLKVDARWAHQKLSEADRVFLNAPLQPFHWICAQIPGSGKNRSWTLKDILGLVAEFEGDGGRIGLITLKEFIIPKEVWSRGSFDLKSTLSMLMRTEYPNIRQEFNLSPYYRYVELLEIAGFINKGGGNQELSPKTQALMQHGALDLPTGKRAAIERKLAEFRKRLLTEVFNAKPIDDETAFSTYQQVFRALFQNKTLASWNDRRQYRLRPAQMNTYLEKHPALHETFWNTLIILYSLGLVEIQPKKDKTRRFILQPFFEQPQKRLESAEYWYVTDLGKQWL